MNAMNTEIIQLGSVVRGNADRLQTQISGLHRVIDDLLELDDEEVAAISMTTLNDMTRVMLIAMATAATIIKPLLTNDEE